MHRWLVEKNARTYVTSFACLCHVADTSRDTGVTATWSIRKVTKVLFAIRNVDVVFQISRKTWSPIVLRQSSWKIVGCEVTEFIQTWSNMESMYCTQKYNFTSCKLLLVNKLTVDILPDYVMHVVSPSQPTSGESRNLFVFKESRNLFVFKFELNFA